MSPRAFRLWLEAALWVAVIFATIPFVRRLREAFVALWPAELIGYSVMAVVATAGIAAAVLLARRSHRLRTADMAWLTVVAAVVLLWTGALMAQPEEAVHFLEYGVLGVLAHRALRTRTHDWTVFVAAALLGSVVGTLDEIVQWIVPDRYFDLRDIVLNGGASALVQVAIWRLAPVHPAPPSPQSVRLLCRLAAAQVVLLMLCLAATPQRLQQIAELAPRLGPLASSIDVPAEYGHLHRLDGRTRFRSRLDRSGLAAADGTRALEVASLLDASRGAYDEFLRTISTATDPFAYEARVHLFARDRNLAEADRAGADHERRRRRLTVAFREQRILESAFGRTLEASSFAWPQPLRDRVAAGQDHETRYSSAVASHLITWIGEGMLRALMAALLAALIVCDLAIGSRRATPPPPARWVRRGRSRGRTGPGTRG
jgi:VanZ family protein